VIWAFLGLTLLFLAYCLALLHEHGLLRPAFTEIAARWRQMPRAQALILLTLLCWAVSYGGSKGNAPVRSPPESSPVNATAVTDPLLLTYQGPLWPFDAFTSNAIAGMVATYCPPIPDAMLASGLALYRVETNTALVANTNAAPIRAWLRHGADNRGVRVEAPFPITVGANTYTNIGILSNGRLAFGYATYHRQPTGDLPFATSYPVVTIAPLWGPLTLLPSSNSVVWTQANGTDSFVVCWEKFLLNGDPALPATVQCEMRRDGTFRFRYGTLAEGVASAGTVGIQNLGYGWTYSHGQTDRIMEGMTITLRPVGLDGWADADPDNDGLTNYEEFMLGTDPLLADTDGDGPSDFWKVTHGFDPRVPQLAPPDPDTDGDQIPDRWEVWLGTPTNNPALGRQDYLDPDGDGFTTWYETHVLGSNPASAASPGAPDANHTDVIAVIASTRACVLRLAGDGNTIEIPWMPGVSPASLRLRLTCGQQYQATLSRVPAGTTFTTDGFWQANLTFAAAPGLSDLALPPVTSGGTTTYYVGTVCIQTPDLGGDFWLAPGVAATPTNNLSAWRINIPWTDAFCHSSTNGTLRLTDDSLVTGTIEWLGLPPVEVRTGNPMTFDPSTVPPGRYTVTARSAANHLVLNTVQVEILHVGTVQSAIWLSAANSNSYTIALSQDTYPTDNIYVWSNPEGIGSLTFAPSSLAPGVYTVYLSQGACETVPVTVNVVGIVKIPLGDSATLQPFTVGKLFLPSKYGGSNTLSGANVELYYTDGSDLDVTKASQLIQGQLATSMVAQGNPCIYQVPNDASGWYYVKTTSPGTVTVTSDFWETGQAATKPWNGWYWPTSSNVPPNLYSSGGPLDKYDQVYGTATRGWEEVNNAGGSNWWGHCWGWSLASILVPAPQARTSSNNVQFTADDMKGLYTELADIKNFDKNDDFSLSGMPAVTPIPDLGDQADPWCGVFHTTLRNNLRRFQNPAQSNLRDNDGNDPTQVWNHAIWKYETQMLEAPGGDETFVRHRTRTYANSDGRPPPTNDTDDRENIYTYDLQYANGDIVVGSSKQNWISARNVKVNPDRIFIPWNLYWIKGSSWVSANSGVTKQKVDGL